MADRLPPNVWVALEAFLGNNNINAGVYLRDQVRQAAHAATISSLSTPPLMLAHAVAKHREGLMSLAALLLVAILNREFCLQAIPEALARPTNDKRPFDLEDLLQFYMDCLRSPYVRGPVAVQICLSVSSLLLLQDGVDVVSALLSLFGGGAAPTTADATCCFLKLLSGVMGVLSDRRVPIGPVRRSSQRACLQKNMHLILVPSLFAMVEEEGWTEEDGLGEEQAAVVAQGVAFLSECNVREAQETAPLFWTRLPLSPFWRGALKRLQQGTASEVVIEAVCAVLRAVTELDAAAVTLLLQALEAVLKDGTCVTMAHVCRVVVSALESSVEMVVLQLTPKHALYQMLASGAQALQRVLTEPTLMASPSSSEIAHVVCEGLSVLTQVFTPLSTPEMDETDDPEDYAIVVERTRQSNQQKMDALLQMRDFLVGCQSLLLAWVRRLSATGLKDVAAYVSKTDGDAFATQPDEVSVSLFVTYERLCRVLLLLPPSYRVQQMEMETLAAEHFLAVVAWDAGLSYGALLALHKDLLLHQHQVFLVPVVVHRFHREWGQSEREKLIPSLTLLLTETVKRIKSSASVAAVSEALCELHAPAVPHMVEALWEGIHLPCGDDETPRRTIVSHLTSLIEQGGVVLPSGCLDDSSLDHYSLAELRSCMLRSLFDVWRVMESLQFMDPEKVESHCVAERVAAWVRTASTTAATAMAAATPAGISLEAGISVHELRQYDAAVHQWSVSNPLHFRVTWRLLQQQQQQSVESERAAEILTSALETFVWRGTEEGAIDWSSERDWLPPCVLHTIAHSQYAPRLQRVLYYITQLSSGCIDDNGVLYRLRAVVRGGNALLDGRRCPPPSILQVFCEVAREYIRLHQTISSGVSWVDVDEQALLADLSKLATVVRLVVLLPLDAPPWLHAVRGAADEFEIRRILVGG